jgi:DNA topoisomerase-1
MKSKLPFGASSIYSAVFIIINTQNEICISLLFIVLVSALSFVLQYLYFMKLLIVESPAKAKTISKYLDGKYTVKASVGHIRDLPKSNKKAIDIADNFKPFYEISKGKESVVSELASLAKGADEVILATDPDREGEAIAWHIAEAIKLKNPNRIVFHEITKDAVIEAMNHPRKIDQNLRKAQEARRVLDRLVGYDLSGLIWKKLRYGLSAGRVQSPALRIVMEREREIRAFIPENYWVITANVQTNKKEKLMLTCEEEPKTQEDADKILWYAEKGVWSVASIKETETKRTARAPFITSTLQQTASNRLGFAPSRTMGIAQKLYESGHITYMRTDSTNLSKVSQDQILAVIEKKFGKEFVSPRSFATKSKNAQEAHEAIRPSNPTVMRAGSTPEQERLYKLIWERTVASQMSDANILKTKISAKVNIDTEENVTPPFSIIGSRILFPGWLIADPEGRGEDVEVPKVAAGDPLKMLEIEALGKQTEPPGRYSEAGLIKELERRGIGRPSTYASIIKTLNDRGYTIKNGKSLQPTDTGETVSSFLEENFSNYISDSFTAEMEESLDDVADGKKQYEKILKDFYGPFQKVVKEKDKLDKITNLGDAPSEFKCPTCESEMVIKLGRTGKFMSCSKFPDCLGARTIDGSELEGPKDTGEACPDCKDGKLMERDGKFGRFIACSNYPKCKHIKKDAELERQNSTGILCPTCKVGMMTERRGRFGIFFSCSNYPKCKNAIKTKPTGNICHYIRSMGVECGALMMEGTKTIPERCSDRICPNHNPHKIDTVTIKQKK